jgi:hypothetical protein
VALKIIQLIYCLKVVINTGNPIYHKYTSVLSVYIIYFFFVVRNELEKIENFEIFVFVLSSHGEEKEEKLLRTDEQGSFQHYFFTKDGQWNTQDLMNEIANLEKLENKLKIFIIQVNLICFSLFSKQKIKSVMVDCQQFVNSR